MNGWDFRLLIHCGKIENSSVALRSATGYGRMEHAQAALDFHQEFGFEEIMKLAEYSTMGGNSSQV